MRLSCICANAVEILFDESGGGTLTLSGNNTYTGGTTVSAGTLLVNGSLANSAVTVGNGGTLGGSGTLGALVTVQSGGVLSPGHNHGSLAAAVLDLQAGSRSYSGVTFQHNANGNWYTPDSSAGQYLVFNPASGQLAIVPEPSTLVMTLMAAGSAVWMAQRRKRAERQRLEPAA
jgi:autotransporter-associated beta strand protein